MHVDLCPMCSCYASCCIPFCSWILWNVDTRQTKSARTKKETNSNQANVHHPITRPYTIIMNLHIPSNAESFKITTSIIFFYFLAEFLTDFLIKQDSIQQTETEIRTMTTRTFFIIEALFHFQLGNQKSATITDLINPMKWTVPTIKDLVVIVVSVFTCVWCKYTKISRNITNSNSILFL